MDSNSKRPSSETVQTHIEIPNSTGNRKRVVIVGAGFGGLKAAKTLGGHPELEVILIDRRNYHLFQPLLYQVATAGLSPADIAVPIRSEVAKHANVQVHMGEVKQVFLREKAILVDHVRIGFDFLILACGSIHSYFGQNSWEEAAPGLKTLEQATEIRRRVLNAFEQAENELDPKVQDEFLTFVVVGGGPTGVELAGALAEISRSILIQDFRRIDSRKTKILLVEAGPRLLSTFAPELSARAEQDLVKLGVQVMTNTKVTELDSTCVKTTTGLIQCRTIIWAAGVQPSNLGRRLGVEADRSGRVFVEPDLSLRNYPDVFVIGDMAHFKMASGNPLPGLAPVALQQGQFAAENILRILNGRLPRKFEYRDKGQMATIGKHKAVVEMKSLKFGGWFAWLTWLVVHIYYLERVRRFDSSNFVSYPQIF
ncbi:MAG: NAD(P)/FAD-dependent oxidoreductase [Bdellovibrionales bacterium]